MKQRKSVKPVVWAYLIFIVVLVVIAILISRFGKRTQEMEYSQYRAALTEGKILEAEIQPNEETPTGTVYIVLKEDATVYEVYVPDVAGELVRIAEAGNIHVYTKDVKRTGYFLTTILPVILFGIVMFIMLMLMTARLNQAGGGLSQMSGFTKNRANRINPKDNPIRFSSVAGLEEEKAELEEVVDFLKNPGKYTSLGARIPKGLLLVGPPGTGKTLLAKAVAGEAGVPFFSISGSDFVEMFVGVGASRVRELFDEAKENAPCFIFIDEIDAVGRIRGSGLGGSHDEREQTLNQLLVEMDGFTNNQGIIVVAATNRADILDPALVRPGRFDRRVSIGRPDVKAREEILRVHAANKKVGEDVDLNRIARTTAGFTGADLENLLNEAAILAAKENRPYFNESDVERSYIKVGIGQEKRSKAISEKDKRTTAYHEMGHAILFHDLPDVGPVHVVSVIPTGNDALGYTMPLGESTDVHYTKSRLEQEIMVAMGGRIAEEIALDDITTGASQDIRVATSYARDMVMKYGMSKLGFINYEQGEEQVFMGRDLGHMKTYGTDVVNEIEAEVRRILSECYDKAKAIIESRRDILDAGVELLMKQERIHHEEFEALFGE